MTTRDPAARPALAHGAVLRHDTTRDVDMILAPERVITLSPTAAAIVRLCTGEHTRDDIVAMLAATYADPGLAGDVDRFLTRLLDLGILR